MAKALEYREKVKYYVTQRDDCIREFAALLPEEEKPEQWLESLGINYIGIARHKKK